MHGPQEHLKSPSAQKPPSDIHNKYTTNPSQVVRQVEQVCPHKTEQYTESLNSAFASCPLISEGRERGCSSSQRFPFSHHIVVATPSSKNEKCLL